MMWWRCLLQSPSVRRRRRRRHHLFVVPPSLPSQSPRGGNTMPDIATRPAAARFRILSSEAAYENKYSYSPELDSLPPLATPSTFNDTTRLCRRAAARRRHPTTSTDATSFLP